MDTSTKVAIFAFLIVGLSVSIIISFPYLIRGTYKPAYAITAYMLTQEPDEFVKLDSPDSVVIQAISNPQEGLIVNQDKTEIMNLIRRHGTSNFAINGSYYQINVAFVDTGPPDYLAVLYPISILAILMSVIVLIVVLALKLIRRYPPKTQQEMEGKKAPI